MGLSDSYQFVKSRGVYSAIPPLPFCQGLSLVSFFILKKSVYVNNSVVY